MADDSNVKFDPQNPYALFSPDQWSNQFSLYNNKALPWPSSYAGWPTDAMGNPIQPPQGMTLNSSPAAPAQPAAQAPPSSQWEINNALINGMQPTLRGAPDSGGRGANQGYDIGAIVNARAMNNANLPGMGLGGTTPMNHIPGATQADATGGPPGSGPGGAAQGGGAVQPAAAGQPSYSQILSMLANPGKVTTPGATVPASASSAQPGPGGLQSFLANWRPASSGPGSGFQNNFAAALKGMGY